MSCISVSKRSNSSAAVAGDDTPRHLASFAGRGAWGLVVVGRSGLSDNRKWTMGCIVVSFCPDGLFLRQPSGLMRRATVFPPLPRVESESIPSIGASRASLQRRSAHKKRPRGEHSSSTRRASVRIKKSSPGSLAKGLTSLRSVDMGNVARPCFQVKPKISPNILFYRVNVSIDLIMHYRTLPKRVGGRSASFSTHHAHNQRRRPADESAAPASHFIGEAMTDSLWLIWSNEHAKWWLPKKRGYTRFVTEAGRYTLVEAEKIVSDTTSGVWLDNQDRDRPPEELIVPSPELVGALMQGATYRAAINQATPLVERLSDADLGGAAVLKAAGVEPMDGFDRERGGA